MEYLPTLHVIHLNQSCFVKGRVFGDSIQVLQAIMSYTLAKQLPGLLKFILFRRQISQNKGHIVSIYCNFYLTLTYFKTFD